MVEKNFNELKMGDIFKRTVPTMSGNKELLFIKIKRRNGKWGAMLYKDFIATFANNSIFEEPANIFSDCSHWNCTLDCDPCTPPIEKKEPPKKKIDKPYLLINNHTGELFRISKEGANLFSYLSENEGDTYSLISFSKSDLIKEF